MYGRFVIGPSNTPLDELCVVVFSQLHLDLCSRAIVPHLFVVLIIQEPIHSMTSCCLNKMNNRSKGLVYQESGPMKMQQVPLLCVYSTEFHVFYTFS